MGSVENVVWSEEMCVISRWGFILEGHALRELRAVTLRTDPKALNHQNQWLRGPNQYLSSVCEDFDSSYPLIRYTASEVIQVKAHITIIIDSRFWCNDIVTTSCKNASVTSSTPIISQI